ncbi:MAG TPA: TonB-dependent receptor [Rhizomicrobium sp.]|jgi:outer membrane receptor protein involved in Fe transport
MRNSFAACLLLSAAVASIAGTVPAKAQSAGAQAGTGGIEEVIVTATRRAEELSKVPQSISAFTAADMEQLDAKSIADLIGYTPGVTYDPASKDISIRGVNSTAGDATTGIYIDDTPIQLRALGFGSDNTLPAVFDLERVEVLRGPQGTLFGAGSEGGTVRYITPQPSLTDFGGFAKAELSTTQDGEPSYEAGVAVGGPIEDNVLGFRVSGWARHDGGWIDKVDYMTGQTLQANTNFVNTSVMRAAMTWQPASDLTVTPSVYYQYRQQNNLDQYWVGLSDPGSGNYKTATPENMGDRDNFVLPSLKVDWNFQGAELISDTSYFNRHEVVQDYSGTLYDLSYFQQSVDSGLEPDFVTPCTGGLCAQYAKLANPPPLLTPNGIDLPGFGHYEATNYITNGQEDFTQEMRLQSNDSKARLAWIVGLFYSHETQLSIEEIRDPQLPALTEFLWGDTMQNIWGEGLLPNGDDYINHTLAHEWQLAGFANATYALTDELKLQAGVRVAKTHFDFINFSDGAQNFGPLSPPGGQENETPITPMGSVSYQFNPDDLVYATISKGYRIGGANPLFPVQACTEIKVEPESYSSDSVVNYEAGSKDRFFDGQVQVSGSVYYLEWSNIQQSVTLPSCAFRYTVNQGAASSKGFDLQGEWALSDDFDAGFSLGYTDAHYTSTIVSAGLILARNGDKLPGSPWSFSVNAQYRKNIWNHDAYVTLQDEFESAETGLTPERDPGTTLFDPGLVPEPSTNMLTLRAGMKFDNLDVSIFADNLLNSHPQLDLNHQDSNTLLFEASTLRPRTIGITGNYQF